jgi:hypothetical protein
VTRYTIATESTLVRTSSDTGPRGAFDWPSSPDCRSKHPPGSLRFLCSPESRSCPGAVGHDRERLIWETRKRERPPTSNLVAGASWRGKGRWDGCGWVARVGGSAGRLSQLSAERTLRLSRRRIAAVVTLRLRSTSRSLEPNRMCSDAGRPWEPLPWRTPGSLRALCAGL